MVYNKHVSTIRLADEFVKWLKHLKDPQARARINLRIRRIDLTGNLGDCKPVGNGVCELRVDYGPGYRLYFAWRDDETILLLTGGDKAFQQHDIKRAGRIDMRYE